MLDLIVGCTNAEADRQLAAGNVGAQEQERWTPLCQTELRAFIGILLLLSVLRGGGERLTDFWDSRFG